MSSLLPFALLSLVAAGNPSSIAIDRPIVDMAGVVPADREAVLSERLAGVTARTGVPIAVLVVLTTAGADIDLFSAAAKSSFDAGLAHERPGVLAVVALDGRRVRMAVHDSLKAQLPDDEVREILAAAAQSLQKGDAAAGVAVIVDGVAARIQAAPARGFDDKRPLVIAALVAAVALIATSIWRRRRAPPV